MTKSQLIEAIAARFPAASHREVEAVVNAVFECMAEALATGQRIEIRGFGSFAVKTRPARSGRNPKTGQPVQVPLCCSLTFTVGKELRDRLNPPAPPARAPAAPPPALEPAAEVRPLRPPASAPASSGAGSGSSAEPLAASGPRGDHYTLR